MHLMGITSSKNDNISSFLPGNIYENHPVFKYLNYDLNDAKIGLKNKFPKTKIHQISEINSLMYWEEGITLIYDIDYRVKDIRVIKL